MSNIHSTARSSLTSFDDDHFTYRVGIIDFLTDYDNAKYLETKFKEMFTKAKQYEVSCQDAGTYCQRFHKFMAENL